MKTKIWKIGSTFNVWKELDDPLPPLAWPKLQSNFGKTLLLDKWQLLSDFRLFIFPTNFELLCLVFLSNENPFNHE
jgi:hypothetical protein